jgi:hypothetical protein
MDRAAVHDEMDRARIEFEQLLGKASPASLRRRSDGTRWTNRQLLFHMLFGYLIVRTLMPLVHAFGRRPDSWSRRFAAILNAGQRPFHVINYVGSWGGGEVLRKSTMGRRPEASEGDPMEGPRLRTRPRRDPSRDRAIRPDAARSRGRPRRGRCSLA